MTNGVPFQPTTRRLGGSSVGVREVKELETILRLIVKTKKVKKALPHINGLY
ncbi:MAG: hypothetical protein WCE25_11650 [Nitrososphaeraceae archaeon]